jgi:hypothetical protein
MRTICLAVGILTAFATQGAGALNEFMRIERSDVILRKVKLEAGRRACVILVGDHNPVQDLTIEVRDSAGNVVARGGGKGQGDMVAAMIYPERTGEFSLFARNGDQEYNMCILAVK